MERHVEADLEAKARGWLPVRATLVQRAKGDIVGPQETIKPASTRRASSSEKMDVWQTACS
jgi:hypothetical protein